MTDIILLIIEKNEVEEMVIFKFSWSCYYKLMNAPLLLEAKHRY